MKDLDFVIERNRDCLVRFGVTDFDHRLPFFRQILDRIGEEQILCWQELLLEPVYWPGISLESESEYYGQKVRLDPIYFDMATKGRILWRDKGGNIVVQKHPWILQAGAYLVDTRQKLPRGAIRLKEWTNEDSFVSRYIGIARRERMGDNPHHLHVPLASPFCVDDKLKQEVIQLLAREPDFHSVKLWRCERVSEFNFIAQCFFHMPRRWDGETNMRAVFDDILMGTDGAEMGGGVEKSYLTGGCSHKGGLADVSSVDVLRVGDANSSHFFRLIGILAMEDQRV